MCSSRRPEFGRRFELSTSAGPSSQRAFAGVRSLIEFEPPREQRTGFYLSPHFLVCAACAAASKARARHSAGRAGYVYCALSRCAMCACMRASRATARLVRRKSRERKGGPGRTVPPLFTVTRSDGWVGQGTWCSEGALSLPTSQGVHLGLSRSKSSSVPGYT